MDNREALRKYAEAADEAAFGEVVRDHGPWLLSAARRQLGDEHLAEDVTQAVFLLLAKRASRVLKHSRLSGWLFVALEYSVRHAKREGARLARREKEAASMRKEAVEEPRWEEVAPELEEAVGKLGKSDRDVVLLRFYEQRSLAEVGKALGISEKAAQKRVERAVEKLQEMLGKKGVKGTTAGLSAVLVGNVVGQMPEHLVGRIVSAVGSGGGSTAAAGIAKGAMKMMVWTKVKVVAILVAIAALGVAVIVVAQQVTHSARQASSAPSVVPPDGKALSIPIGPVIDAYAETASRTMRSRIRGTMKGSTDNGDGTEPTHFEYQYDRWVDVNRIDVRKKTWSIDGSGRRVRGGDSWSMVTPEMALTAGTDPGAKFGTVVLTRQQSRIHDLSKSVIAGDGAFLDCYCIFAGGLRAINVPEVLKQNIASATAAETVLDGEKCLQVGVAMKDAKIVAWLVPAKTFCCIRLEIVHGPMDLYNDEDGLPFASHRTVVEKIKLKQIAGTWMAVEGTFTHSTVRSSGDAVTQTISASRESVDLAPDFLTPGVFSLSDLPDGCKIYIEEAGGVPYEWRNGEISKEPMKNMVQRAEREKHER